MDEFLIVSNSHKDKNFIFAKKVAEYIKSKGKKGTISKSDFSGSTESFKYTNPMNVSRTTECVIAIGGDGTLIQAAKDMMNFNVVFIGINLGKLGFLAEINKNNFAETIDRLISNDYLTEERMMLKGDVLRDDKVIAKNVALNDIALHRGAEFGMISFKIYVNGRYLSLYNADGVIFSTPTGSTAYNLSAGGPIVEPDAKLILLTPICAHTMNSHSIVLAENDEIVVEICGERSSNTILNFDGDNIARVKKGDKIVIRKYELCTKIAKLNKSSFIEILKEKMGNR